MKFIILALFFTSFIPIQAKPVLTKCSTRMSDEGAVDLFDEAPEQELEPRELPWYLDIISVPGARILVFTCNAWDWSVQKMNSLKNVCILLLQKMHLKKQSSTTDIQKGFVNAGS